MLFSAALLDGGQLGVQVDLTPLSAYRVLGIPGEVLADQVADLSEVAPLLASNSFRDRLASCVDWPQRLILVEQTLVTMAANGPEPDGMVTWIWRQLQASGGQARIASLVAETGFSHRHVNLARRV